MCGEGTPEYFKQSATFSHHACTRHSVCKDFFHQYVISLNSEKFAIEQYLRFIAWANE